MRMRMLACAAELGACLAFSAAAATTEGSTRLICATTEAMDCEAGAACFRGTPSQVGAPAFMRVDLEQKTIAGPNRSTPILFMERNEKTAQVLLQGTEIGFGWTLAIDMKAGTMAATLVNGDGAFVLFGACT